MNTRTTRRSMIFTGLALATDRSSGRLCRHRIDPRFQRVRRCRWQLHRNRPRDVHRPHRERERHARGAAHRPVRGPVRSRERGPATRAREDGPGRRRAEGHPARQRRTRFRRTSSPARRWCAPTATSARPTSSLDYEELLTSVGRVGQRAARRRIHREQRLRRHGLAAVPVQPRGHLVQQGASSTSSGSKSRRPSTSCSMPAQQLTEAGYQPFAQAGPRAGRSRASWACTSSATSVPTP